MDGKFVSYLRVSTIRQGASGLGLEAQRSAVADYLNGGRWKLLAEFVEIESGKKADRPKMQAALERCRLTGATLLVAKMDRLSRNLHFITGLQLAGVRFTAVDNPQVNDTTVQILAAVAEAEGKAISARTKAALAASGKKLGGYRGGPKVTREQGNKGRSVKTARCEAFNASVRPLAVKLRGEGMSLRQIAAALTEQGVLTYRGAQQADQGLPWGGAWTAVAVSTVLAAG